MPELIIAKQGNRMANRAEIIDQTDPVQLQFLTDQTGPDHPAVIRKMKGVPVYGSGNSYRSVLG
ncbi:MAG: hypothetical protein Pars92KO_20340 [Parasphingorhabdus sp.]